MVVGGAWLLLTPIRFGFKYDHRDDQDVIQLRLALGVWPRFTLTIPFRKTVRWSKKAKRRFFQMPRAVQTAMRKTVTRRVVRLLTRPIPSVFRVVEHLDWKTVIGTGDAALTSWAAGALWFVKSTVMARLAHALTFVTAPKLEVTPDYRRACLHMEVACIFRFTIGEIIIAALPWSARRYRG